MATSLHELYKRFSPTVVRITSADQHGDLSNGAGFHIGNGYIATARHVLDQRSIVEIVPHRLSDAETSLELEQVYFLDDPRVDVAVFKSNFSLSHYMSNKYIVYGEEESQRSLRTDFIPIGGHLDDWLGDELNMTRAVVMGFPPIPFSNGANLVSVSCEINTVIDEYVGPHPHFIVSSIPRGGFSGGPAISEFGFLLGIVTESLFANGKPLETGYTSVISVEPLINLLLQHKLFPFGNEELLNELLDPGSTSLNKPE